MKKTTKLRELIERHEILVCPGAYDAMGAKIIEMLGFEAIYMTGYGTSLSFLGLPDAGLITMPEMILVAKQIANITSIPVIADADTGYGNAINVMRTVREYIQAGIAGIHIEDQIFPKKCGHVAGKRLISLEEAMGKYEAANEVRNKLDKDFVIIARTDAVGAVEGGLDEAIKRGRAYYKAGADVIFVEGLASKEDAERVSDQLDVPLLYNNGYSSIKSPLLSIKVLEKLGFDIVIYSTAVLIAGILAIYDHLKSLKERGTAVQVELEEKMRKHFVGDLHEFAGFPEIMELEYKFLPKEEH